MLTELFSDLRAYLNSFFQEVSLESAETILQKLISCQGMIFLTGVGKSGHIAQKIAATLISTGTKAMYLCPNRAVHGDLGLISAKDTVLFLSKSGETEELLYLLLAIQERNATTIAIVSQIESQLAKKAHFSIYLPVQKEICPYNLAPTTSTIIQLIFGDCLAVALMKKREFSLHHFASNHPGGLIGRKIGFKVSDLMLKNEKIPLCKPTDTLIDTLHELSAKKCGCLLVENEGKLCGIFTDGDLRRTIETHGKDGLTTEIGKLMTTAPRSISPHSLAFEALDQMEANERPVTVLPVVENGKLLGLIRMHDILQAASPTPREKS